jgi:hypothetical protein
MQMYEDPEQTQHKTDWLRDPIWQSIGAILTAVSIIGLIFSVPDVFRPAMVAVACSAFVVCGFALVWKKINVVTPRKVVSVLIMAIVVGIFAGVICANFDPILSFFITHIQISIHQIGSQWDAFTTKTTRYVIDIPPQHLPGGLTIPAIKWFK